MTLENNEQEVFKVLFLMFFFANKETDYCVTEIEIVNKFNFFGYKSTSNFQNYFQFSANCGYAHFILPSQKASPPISFWGDGFSGMKS